MADGGFDPLTAGISAAGNVAGHIIDSNAMTSANDANIAFSREKMNWDLGTSATQYQRAVADMQRAGLNPALMFKSGGPSGVAPATSATVQPYKSSLGEGLSKSISNAIQSRDVQSQIESREKQNKFTDAQTLKTAAETLNSSNNAAESGIRLKILQKQLPNLLNNADINSQVGGVQMLNQNIGAWMQGLLNSFGVPTNAKGTEQLINKAKEIKLR